ncbi:MAG: nucleotidyltransferase domain-containing protein [Planctomycetota bacterium]
MLDQVLAKRDEIETLGRTHHARTLWLFGSAACGDFDPETSDLDFLVIFEPDHEGSAWDAYWGLQEGLQAMFGRKVDLVDREAMKNRYVIESVDATRKLIYGPEEPTGLSTRYAG